MAVAGTQVDVDETPDPAAARLDAVARYEVLDAPSDGAFDDIARLAALAFDTPIATVSIVDAGRVWFAATHGLDGVTQIGDEPGLCASAILSDEFYLVTDAAIDPRTLDHPLVRGELGLRFYAAAPIVTADGHRLGTVNVLDTKPHQVSASQTATLTYLAAVVARQLDLRLQALQAVRAERELRAAADRRAAEATEQAARVAAVAAVSRATAAGHTCALGSRNDPCHNPADLKIADGWGDSAWGCAGHAELALLTARGVFLADPNQGVLAAFLDRP
jgi:GAF domain-containing protein